MENIAGDTKESQKSKVKIEIRKTENRKLKTEYS
jgi:hypothetical protein